jgi:hypothetical protein
MNNPYKKEYKQSYCNTMSTKKPLEHVKQHKPNKLNKPNKTYKSYSLKKMFNCNICKLGFTSPMVLDKHTHIHINPVYCPFTNCDKVFSPKHTYQYRQHMDGHNGGLNIKCKFCTHSSRSMSSNTSHMKSQHIEEYTKYTNKINEYNDDIKTLDTTYITNLTHLTTNYINTAFIKSRAKKQDLESPAHKCSVNTMEYACIKPLQEDDPELTYIEYNKYYYDEKYYDNEKNNLDLFVDIALSYSQSYLY